VDWKMVLTSIMRDGEFEDDEEDDDEEGVS
jgi:hypothetical protein